MTRSGRLAIAVAWLVGTTPGCFLVGYDSVDRTPFLDAGDDYDAGDHRDAGDHHDAGGLDASNPMPDGGPDAELPVDPMDAGSRADGEMPEDDAAAEKDAGDASSHDAGDASAEDAGDDAGPDDAGDASDTGDASDASDAASPCPAPNACGGCEPLSHEVGEGCGVCGLGRYVCDGEENVVCNGGAAYPSASGGEFLVDDFEDGDRFVQGAGNLSGDWHSVQDGSGGTLAPAAGTPLVPVAGGAAGSAYAMRLSGHGFKTWGAGMAVSLNALSCRYDASKQQGIRFSVKGSGSVIVSVATRQTTPPSAGGTCNTNACNDHFNKTFPLTGSWTSHTLPFSSLSQTGWGTPALFNASQLLYLQFSFGPNTTFDLYVDNVRFY